MPTPLPRGAVAIGVGIGIIAVSTAAILARIAMGGQPGVLTAGPGGASALAIAFWRTALGALALSPAAWWSMRVSGGPSRRDHRALAGAGLALAGHLVLFQGALALTSVATAVTLTTMSPLFVAVGSWWLLGERAERRSLVGVALTIAGALVIGVASARGDDPGGTMLLGDLMALAAAVGGAAYLLAGRRSRRHLSTSTYAAIVYAWAAVLLLAVALVTDTALTGFDPRSWLAIAGIVIGPQLLGHTVFNLLLSTLSATAVSTAILAEPVGAAVLAWLLLDEVPTAWFALGAPLVLIGVLLVIRRRTVPAAPP